MTLSLSVIHCVPFSTSNVLAPVLSESQSGGVFQGRYSAQVQQPQLHLCLTAMMSVGGGCTFLIVLAVKPDLVLQRPRIPCLRTYQPTRTTMSTHWPMSIPSQRVCTSYTKLRPTRQSNLTVMVCVCGSGDHAEEQAPWHSHLAPIATTVAPKPKPTTGVTNRMSLPSFLTTTNSSRLYVIHFPT
jgi:hypothetical protein